MFSSRFKLIVGSVLCKTALLATVAGSAAALPIQGGRVDFDTADLTRPELELWIDALHSYPEDYELSREQATELVIAIELALSINEFDHITPNPVIELAKDNILRFSDAGTRLAQLGEKVMAGKFQAISDEWKAEAREPQMSSRELWDLHRRGEALSCYVNASACLSHAKTLVQNGETGMGEGFFWLATQWKEELHNPTRTPADQAGLVDAGQKLAALVNAKTNHFNARAARAKGAKGHATQFEALARLWEAEAENPRLPAQERQQLVFEGDQLVQSFKQSVSQLSGHRLARIQP